MLIRSKRCKRCLPGRPSPPGPLSRSRPSVDCAIRNCAVCAWPDFTGDELRVSPTVWGRYVSELKTRASAAPVPVLPFLCRALGECRKRNQGDGYIVAGSTGAPLNLANLLRRMIVPALDTCATYAEPKSTHGEGTDHNFRPDAKAPKWRGWHAFRRGLATNLYRLGVRERTIQEILRHANVSTTLAFYVKPASTDGHAAMAKLEKALGNNWATERIRPA
jgi:integrase